MLEHPGFDERDLSSLTKVASGGAPVYAGGGRALGGATGDYLHNTYGLTETAAPSHLVPAGRAGAGRPGERRPLGRACRSPTPTSRIVGSTTARAAGRRGGRDRHPRPAVMPGYWSGPRRPPHAIAGRLAAHRRRRQARRGRLVLPRRSDQGHDQRLRLQGLAARGRGRPLRAPGGGRGRRGRRARRLPRRDGRGLRGRCARAEPRRPRS